MDAPLFSSIKPFKLSSIRLRGISSKGCPGKNTYSLFDFSMETPSDGIVIKALSKVL